MRAVEGRAGGITIITPCDRPSSLMKVEGSGQSHGSRGHLRFADDEEPPSPTSAAAQVQRSAASSLPAAGAGGPLGVMRSSPSLQNMTRSVFDGGPCGRPPARPAMASVAVMRAALLAKEAEGGRSESDRPDAPRNIWEAAERGMTGFIVRLVERNVEFNVNQRDKLLRTALHWAVECNHKGAVECLLDYNADITATECNGRTAVHLASRAGHAELLGVLLETVSAAQREVMCNQADMYGITPVFMAYQKGDNGRAAFDVLVSSGGRYNQKTIYPAPVAAAVSPVEGLAATLQVLALAKTQQDVQ